MSWITLALTLGLGAARPAPAQPTDLPGSSPPAAEEWRVVERGQDFAVFQRFRARAQADGSLRWQPGGRYTLLENGLHYRDPVSGQWQESRDLIERFPDGAIARYGPLRAIFSHDLNTESVFDLETPAGARLRGGLRALEWLDEATGRRQPLARVRTSAPLELVPPNWLVARDAFDGVAADVVLEWRHDRFSQNVVLRELPWPPEGFAPGTTRLVVVTEFLETPEPVLQRVAVPGAGGQAVSDDVGIHFDGASILQGHAFAVRAGSEWALQVGVGGAPGEAVEVRKVWTPDGAVGAVLEESVAWEALARLAANLPRQARTAVPAERDWRSARAERVSARQPVEVAQLPYQPAGVVVDFEILPGSASGFTFQMGQTYYVRNNFYVGPGPVTFQPGCVIKFKHNTWLLAYGPVSFPDTLQTPVFTSRNDDSFGEKIAGVQKEPDSDGDPSKHRAAQALWIYYVDFDTTVRNARFRWAQTGIQYDVNPGVYITHRLQRTLLEHCDTGVYVNLQDASLILTEVQQHNVNKPISCLGYPYYPCGNISGTISPAPFFMVNSFRGIDSSDEPNWQTNFYANPYAGVADTMGAAGTTQYVEMLNGKITVFAKTNGAPQDTATLPNFLYAVKPADPRILFDPHSQRWVSTAKDDAAKELVLKVSLSASADLVSTNWRHFSKSFGLTGDQYLDFGTLGVDANGIYASIQVRGTNQTRYGYRIQVFKKPYVYDNPEYTNALPAAIVVTPEELDTWCIQPASNFDNSPAGGYVWFVAKGPPEASGGGRIKYRRLQWTGTNSVAWADAGWLSLPNPTPPGYTNYYDIPQTTPGLYAPYSGSTGSGLNLAHVGSRLMMAVIRGTNLWTCHHIGLDGSDGDYDGRFDDGTAVDRSAIQWFQLQAGTSGLTYLAHGRIYDAASNNPYWFYYPSLSVNSVGHVLMGFSGSRATEYVRAYWVGRQANGQTTRPTLLQAGRASWTSDRWGDYSATCTDPGDDSFWTVQEFSSRAYEDDGNPYKIWATWIGQIRVLP